MNRIYILLIVFIFNYEISADESLLVLLQPINIESNTVEELHKYYEGKELEVFFKKYGESSNIGRSGITIFFYKTIDGKVLMVGTANQKSILYVQIQKP